MSTVRELFERCRNTEWSEPNAYAVQWSVELQGDTAFLFVRETSGLDSWLRVNCRFAPSGADVHRGFARAWRSIRDDVYAELDGATRVVAAGFSKGGGVLQAAHVELSERYDVETTVFGAPRVWTWLGWWRNRDAFSNLTRVYVRGDAVTKLPPLVLGFRHVGRGRGLGVLGLIFAPIAGPLALVWRAAFHHPKRYERLLRNRE